MTRQKRKYESARIVATTKEGVTFASILTQDPAMQDGIEQARRAAGTDATVILLGENGTGKNLFAQAIHGSC